MVFVGDIAFPKGEISTVLPNGKVFGKSSVIANLEGAILQQGEEPRGTNLYNDRVVLPYLRENNIRLVSLANNHITDLDSSPKVTIDVLLEHGILSCGAGDSLDEAARAVLLADSEGEVVFLGFGWDVIGCRIASKDRAGVNPLSQESVLICIDKTKKAFPDRRIVLLVHWNYELELYPQPIHRHLAHMAIDHGASAVIGCHSHCVQGIEVYSGCPIVYGLGNWFLPEGHVFGRDLKFPDFALRQLAFEWVLASGEMRCHWFLCNRQTKSVEYESSENLQGSSSIKTLTPFVGMSHRDYVQWFKKHRRKRILLPIYEDSSQVLMNKLKDVWVKMRHELLSAASMLSLKGGLR